MFYSTLRDRLARPLRASVRIDTRLLRPYRKKNENDVYGSDERRMMARAGHIGHNIQSGLIDELLGVRGETP
jgi:hypothetical protein